MGVVQTAGQAGHLIGAAGPIDSRGVLDDPQAALDGPHEVVSLFQVVVGLGSDHPGLLQGIERLPEICDSSKNADDPSREAGFGFEEEVSRFTGHVVSLSRQ